VITLNDTAVRTLAGVPSGAIIMPTNFWGKSNIVVVPTQQAIFGFGDAGNPLDTRQSTNLVSNTGVVATEVNNPTAQRRSSLAAATYGGDKALFGFGNAGTPVSGLTAITNLVSNTGVVAADTPGVGTVRRDLAAAGYGADKALFGFGNAGSPIYATAITNLVSNTGVVAADTPGVGTIRRQLSATRYGGGGKAIFGFGVTAAPTSTFTSITNLVSTTGVVATDTPGVGTARSGSSAATYGGDKALFAYGTVSPVNITVSNLVSNTGVVAADTPVLGVRFNGAAAGYGGDKAIFGYGRTAVTPSPSPGYISSNNLVSNTGVIAATTSGQPRSRGQLACAGFSST
jgi:NAD(P)H-hydrate repair Nnr-like enzyme with NAD(P)H-hydrate epimerase domain